MASQNVSIASKAGLSLQFLRDYGVAAMTLNAIITQQLLSFEQNDTVCANLQRFILPTVAKSHPEGLQTAEVRFCILFCMGSQ